MPDPTELLAVARGLADSSNGKPSDAKIRRAVSTVYYAAFHFILRKAATRFMGHGAEPGAGYAVLYRSFDHDHMKRICEGLNVTTLKKSLQRQLKRGAVSQEIRDFAAMFVPMQELRHLADYDPHTSFESSDALALAAEAEAAMAAFDRAAPEEQADILALLMVKARA